MVTWNPVNINTRIKESNVISVIIKLYLFIPSVSLGKIKKRAFQDSCPPIQPPLSRDLSIILQAILYQIKKMLTWFSCWKKTPFRLEKWVLFNKIPCRLIHFEKRCCSSSILSKCLELAYPMKISFVFPVIIVWKKSLTKRTFSHVGEKILAGRKNLVKCLDVDQVRLVPPQVCVHHCSGLRWCDFVIEKDLL